VKHQPEYDFDINDLKNIIENVGGLVLVNAKTYLKDEMSNRPTGIVFNFESLAYGGEFDPEKLIEIKKK